MENEIVYSSAKISTHFKHLVSDTNLNKWNVKWLLHLSIVFKIKKLFLKLLDDRRRVRSSSGLLPARLLELHGYHRRLVRPHLILPHNCVNTLFIPSLKLMKIISF